MCMYVCVSYCWRKLCPCACVQRYDNALHKENGTKQNTHIPFDPTPPPLSPHKQKHNKQTQIRTPTGKAEFVTHVRRVIVLGLLAAATTGVRGLCFGLAVRFASNRLGRFMVFGWALCV